MISTVRCATAASIGGAHGARSNITQNGAIGWTRRSIASSQLTVEKTTDNSRFETCPVKEKLQFGQTFADHMLMVEWEISKGGWQAPRIVPYQDLKISPAASSLHYGKRCGSASWGKESWVKFVNKSPLNTCHMWCVSALLFLHFLLDYPKYII
jgi:hypothetical protein